MLKGKIYEYMKKYLDAYLYDFDETKMGMSFLSGSIQMSDLHIRQDMANRLIDSFGIPLQLKAGLIQNVQVSFSVLNFWNSPLQLEIDDVYLVCGPSTFFRSNDESYIEENQEDLLDASYDSTNAFNVFEHEMKIKATANAEEQLGPKGADANQKALDNLRYLSTADFLKTRLIEDEGQVRNVRLIFKNLKVSIRKLHIRYEDDHYQLSPGKNYAFGITLESLRVYSGNEDWDFSEQNSQQQNRNRGGRSGNQDAGGFTRLPVDTRNKYKEYAPDSANLLIKEVAVSQVQIYYDNTGQIMIPQSAIDEAEALNEPRIVFERVPVRQIIQQMSSVFEPAQSGSDNPRNPYLVVEKFTAQAHIFSYRSVDYENLFSWLQSKLGKDAANFSNPAVMNRNQWGAPTPSKYKEIHQQQYQFFRNEFSLKFSLQPTQQGRSIVVNVTPSLILGVKALNFYIENYYIAQDLKQYRPQRRPYTQSQVRGISKKVLRSERFQRKRRNAVRDWMYYVVWYVRLKKILDLHRNSSVSASPSSIIFGQTPSEAANPVQRSPIQDSTQLTTMAFVFGFPTVQIKFFENNQKMKEFYLLQGQTNQQRGGGIDPTARRVAPISINIHSSVFSSQNYLVYQEHERDIRIKGIDLYLSRVEEHKGGRESIINDNANWGNKSRVKESLGVQKMNRSKTNQQIIHKSNRPQGATSNLFNTHKLSTNDLRKDPNIMEFGNSNEQDQRDYQMQNYDQEKPYSVWNSLFSAIKNLFNMNYNVEATIEPRPSPGQQQMQMYRGSEARKSMNRGINFDSPGGVIGRSSLLNNAQLELTRVKQGDRNATRRAGLEQNQRTNQARQNSPWQGADPNRRSVVNQDRQGQQSLQNSTLEQTGAFNDESDLQNKSDDFSSMVNKFVCSRNDDLQTNLYRGQMYEITQYPLIRTILPEQSFSQEQSGEFLLALSFKIAKQQSLHLECDIDRPLEFTYCAQDILDILISPQNGMVQSYVQLAHQILAQPMSGVGSKASQKESQIQDFKPLWAIRRSMQQHTHKILNRNHLNLKKQQSPRISIIQNGLQKDRYRGGFNASNQIDGDGENIVEDDNDPGNALNSIACKPSINQSNKKVDIPEETRNNKQIQSMQSSLYSRDKRAQPGGKNFIPDETSMISHQGSDRTNKITRMSGPNKSMAHLKGSQNTFEDKYLHEALIKCGKVAGFDPRDRGQEPLISVEIHVNCTQNLQVLSGIFSQSRGSTFQPVCKIKIQPTGIFFQRSQQTSSFTAFGIEFESTNKMKVMQLFARQLHDTMIGFIESPIFMEFIQSEKIYNQLSEAFRVKMYQKKKLKQIANKPRIKNNRPQNHGPSSMLQNKRNGSFNRMKDFGTEQSNRNHNVLDSSLNSTNRLKFPSQQLRPMDANNFKKHRNSQIGAVDSEVIDLGSSSGSDAQKRYQSIKDEDNDQEQQQETPNLNQRQSQGAPAGQVPVQIKQVSQLNMQIIYNNIEPKPQNGAQQND